MLLYKYCRSDGVEMLRKCNLRITPPQKFNDPFEFLADVSYPNEESLLVKHNTRLSLKKVLGEFYGVLSLSYNRDNITMWAHYAEGHEGIVVGLETNEIGKMENGKYIEVFKVKYTQKRVFVRFDHNAKPLFDENMIDLCVTKSNVWAYEDEYRILFNYKKLGMAQDDGYYYQPISPLGIKSVVLGCNCKEQLMNDIIIELASERYKHVKLFQAHLDYHDFKLIMIDFTDRLEQFRRDKDLNKFYSKPITVI